MTPRTDRDAGVLELIGEILHRLEPRVTWDLEFTVKNAQRLSKQIEGSTTFRHLAGSCRSLVAELEAIQAGQYEGSSARARSYDRAQGLARQLEEAISQADGDSHRPVATARRLVTVATRLLPAIDRARYIEEFRSELWELVAAGAGRRAQVQHAIRLLCHTGPLRLELRAHSRRRTSP